MMQFREVKQYISRTASISIALEMETMIIIQ